MGSNATGKLDVHRAAKARNGVFRASKSSTGGSSE